ncbi:hypothetical protein SUDANB15_02614 [Streptomyces sp. enrichment culture]
MPFYLAAALALYGTSLAFAYVAFARGVADLLVGTKYA